MTAWYLVWLLSCHYNFLYRVIRYQLYQSKKYLNLIIISVKRVTPLERTHETERKDLFPASLGYFSQEIQSNRKRRDCSGAFAVHSSCVLTLSFEGSHLTPKKHRGSCSGSFLLHILRSFSFCNLSCTEIALKIGDFYFVVKL